jgi:hypothetical protein
MIRISISVAAFEAPDLLELEKRLVLAESRANVCEPNG